MKGLVLTLLLAFAPAASGKMLYRCPGQGPNGATLIQDSPCPEGRAPATALDGREIRVSPQRERQLAAQRARIERQQALAIGRVGRQPSYRYNAPTEAQRRRQTCENAKAWRDARRRSLSLNRTYEQLSALDRRVRQECKGVR